MSFVASEMPGLGNPWLMTMDTFFGLITAHCERKAADAAASSGDMRAMIEADKRRLRRG